MRRAEGFTLVELLLASTLMLIVLFATLMTMDGFIKNNARTTKQVTSIDNARNAMSRLTRDLRDATAATPNAGPGEGVISRAGSQDLVMRRIDPVVATSGANVTGAHTVRWCLEPVKKWLYRLTAGGIATPPADCPGDVTGWHAAVQAQEVVNGGRPAFTYDTATPSQITSVNVFLAVDAHPTRPPVESTLTSGVFLRNQNRRPTVAFSFVTLGGRNVQLNGQPSRDPEGGILSYEWSDGGAVLPHTGAVVSYLAPDSGDRTITLTVHDTDGLSASRTQTVDVKP